MILPSFAGPMSIYNSETSLDAGQETVQVQQMQQVHQMATLKRPSVAATSYEESSVLY